MKKFISFITIVAVIFALMMPVNASAEGVAVTLTGPKTVRAGDTLAIKFNINGSGVLGASGSLKYNVEQLTLVSAVQEIGAPWVVEFNGNNFVAYDNNLSNPINGEKTLFVVTFTVNDIAVGTKIDISYTDVIVSDGGSDNVIGTVSYSKSIAKPLSDDVSLASLVVSNATLTPAFDPAITEYAAQVPFSVSKLNISAMPNDTKAKVSIYSPNLAPGAITKATVTVTAESGAVNVYTISVKREADPSYTPNTNNLLSSIKVDGFMLSPAFKADVTEYVVWLPYEVDEIKVSAVAADIRASVEIIGGKNLAAGQDNIVNVVCMAESGDKKIYKITAKRAAAHDGSVDEKPADPSVDVNDTVSTDSVGNGGDSAAKIPTVWLVTAVVASLGIGFVVGFLTKKRLAK